METEQTLTPRERHLIELTYQFCQGHPLGVEDMEEVAHVVMEQANAAETLPPGI